ncbi:AP2 domain-containing protein [Peribacillus butanolivorans]|uniref:AP2 domain-containing protein n=1 Tax=Peribacillus butanolivorans TaxID=421767 RepID=UPI00207CC766|nr:AP2 domain-containing protein [Peribacillus butanolivorans]
MSRTRFYNIWSKMIQRCNNPNTTEYINYGGRGIKVTDRWLTHEYFMEDMFESYLEHVAEYGELDTTIDRINNEGGYDPVNCKWSTRLEQVRNRRKNSTNKSGVSGVHWDSRSNRWLAGITVNGNRIRLGSYKELELAAEARKQAELDYWS